MIEVECALCNVLLRKPYEQGKELGNKLKLARYINAYKYLKRIRNAPDLIIFTQIALTLHLQ